MKIWRWIWLGLISLGGTDFVLYMASDGNIRLIWSIFRLLGFEGGA